MNIYIWNRLQQMNLLNFHNTTRPQR